MRTSVRIVLVGCLFLASHMQCWAQVWHDIRTSCPKATDSGQQFKACAAALFSDTPLHLTAGSIVPMGQLAGGVALKQEFDKDSHHTIITGSFLYSVKGFWATQGQLLLVPVAYKERPDNKVCWGPFCTPDRLTIKITGMHRELRGLNYFGLGNSSSSIAHLFGERETVGGLEVVLPVNRWVVVEGLIEGRQPELARSGDPSSVPQTFTELTAPGLAAQPSFMRYKSNFLYRIPKKNSSPTDPIYIANTNLGYNWYQDLNNGHYSFGQFEADSTRTWNLETANESGSKTWFHHLFCPKKKGGFCEYGEINLHGRLIVSHAPTGNAIPFYYQPTQGGSDIDGTETLRGYTDYRFRGPDSLLLQAEYGRHVWSLLGMYAFYDAGKVTLKGSDITLNHLRQDGGLGITAQFVGEVAVRAYVAMGGGHGAQLGWNLKRAF
jgi:hypothetical protein